MPTFLIADDHPLFRDALRTAVLRVWPDAQIHEADNIQTLYDLVREQGDADLLLLDLSMPGAGPDALLPLLHVRTQHPQLPVAIVSAHEDAHLMRRTMDCGAMGYVPKSSDLHTLSQALRTILDGEPWFVRDVLDTVGEGAADEGFPSGVSGALGSDSLGSADLATLRAVRELTPQQTRVLQMVAAGRLNKQIAHDLGLSEATIKAHVTAVLRKLGASNRTEAVAIARRLGLA